MACVTGMVGIGVGPIKRLFRKQQSQTGKIIHIWNHKNNVET